MTAPPATPCGYPWPGPCVTHRGRVTIATVDHRCAEPVDHDDPCPCPPASCVVHCAQPPVHRCRCGATNTTREEVTDG